MTHDEDLLRERLEWGVRLTAAVLCLGLVGAALSGLGVPRTPTWAFAVGAAVAGWWAADRCVRGHRHGR
ncbi:hypothetical protein [Streptomyces sp. NPDC005438]|uniref:hypothetical protein n=1 Tax=Streptomyces sp. NPDC005438 TaxID=3156880 RepID=UPI0033B06665